jgi:hypothetical protein
LKISDAEAERFTAGLGLPAGWLDTPRIEADIPESVAQLLAPASRVRAPGQAPAPTAAAAYEDTQVAAAPTSEMDGALPSTSSNPYTEPLPADAAGHGNSIGSPQHEKVSGAVSLPPLSTSESTATPPSAALGTNLDGLDGIPPIAEALLKTLAGKARTGRLDELKALELLQQAVLL